jgi:large subunit ribosomal protein L25
MSETADLVITVERREDQGKSSVAKLRREGRIPAVVYGGGKPPISISVDEEDLHNLLKQEGGENTIFLLKLAGTKEERRAMIKEKQLDPITGRFLHLDFIRVMRGHKLTVAMPVELVGDCIGVRHGGRVDFVSRELQVEVLPREMFDRIEVDISALEAGEHVAVSDLESKLPESGRFVEDPNRVVVLIEMPRGAAVEAGEAAEEPELVTAEQTEPEVIRKGKSEEEEG